MVAYFYILIGIMSKPQNHAWPRILQVLDADIYAYFKTVVE